MKTEKLTSLSHLDGWHFAPPPVCTLYWELGDWERYITKTGTPPHTVWRISQCGLEFITKGERNNRGELLYKATEIAA